MDSRSSKPPKPDSRSRPPDSHSLDGRDLESIYLDSRPLKQLSHPLENNHEEDEVGELPAEAETSLNGEKVPKEGIESVPNKQRGEAGPGSVTSKPPRDGGTRGGGGSKEYARQHMRQNGPLGDDVYQNSSERYEDERPVRTRYSVNFYFIYKLLLLYRILCRLLFHKLMFVSSIERKKMYAVL